MRAMHAVVGLPGLRHRLRRWTNLRELQDGHGLREPPLPLRPGIVCVPVRRGVSDRCADLRRIGRRRHDGMWVHELEPVCAGLGLRYALPAQPASGQRRVHPSLQSTERNGMRQRRHRRVFRSRGLQPGHRILRRVRQRCRLPTELDHAQLPAFRWGNRRPRLEPANGWRCVRLQRHEILLGWRGVPRPAGWRRQALPATMQLDRPQRLPQPRSVVAASFRSLLR